MNTDYPVMLDACVLLPMPLADTLLRLAETPRLYLPRWSSETLSEVSRNLIEKFGKTVEQVERRETALRKIFPEALVEGYERLIPSMTNNEKDRHVLAAAVFSKTPLIVTHNARHFTEEMLAPWGIKCKGPSTFLQELYDLEPGIVAQRLTEQTCNIDLEIEALLLRLQKDVPSFVAYYCEEQEIQL